MHRILPQLTGGWMGIGRPPLPVGTIGKIRLYQVPAGYRARTLIRDFDGHTRGIERTGPTKGAAERALKEAVRDRTHGRAGADITPHTRVQVLAEAWVESLDKQSPTTRQSYRNRVLAQIVPGLGGRGSRALRWNRGPVPAERRRTERASGRQDDPLGPIRHVRPSRMPRRADPKPSQGGTVYHPASPGDTQVPDPGPGPPTANDDDLRQHRARPRPARLRRLHARHRFADR